MEKPKYKLIAVDMDGTLLNSEGKISPKTADAIMRARQAGVMFTVSTGRPIQGIEIYNDILRLDAPVITYNGAMLVHGKTKEVLYSCNMENEDVLAAFRMGEERGTLICVWSAGQLYVNMLDDKIERYCRLTGVPPMLLTDIDPLLKVGVTKMIWYSDVDNIKRWLKEISPTDFKSVTYCTSQPIFLEFFNKKASKALALEKIGEMYGIKRDMMIAVGDGFNDIPMLEYAGLGVAMANAPEEVKKHADHITLSNDEDGIASVIDDLVLKF